jgi:general secretion pathway protein B
MSLILEALRKSEAERRLGSAPDLLTAMPVLRAPAPRRRWPLAMAGALLLLLAMLSSLWWWTRNAPTPRAATVAPSSQGPAETDANAENGVHRNAPQTSVDAPTTRPAPTVAPRAVESSRVAASIHPVAAKITPATAPASVAAEPAQPGTAPAAATPAPMPAMPVASVPAAEPALLSLADLSTGERNGLPALKVSMHVYADDPAHRFMIIDGQRVAEGARLADGVILVRIRRDGAELDVRGRRLLLPKP